MRSDRDLQGALLIAVPTQTPTAYGCAAGRAISRDKREPFAALFFFAFR